MFLLNQAKPLLRFSWQTLRQRQAEMTGRFAKRFIVVLKGSGRSWKHWLWQRVARVDEKGGQNVA